MKELIENYLKTKDDKYLVKLFNQFKYNRIVNFLKKFEGNQKDIEFILDYIEYLKEENEQNPYNIYLNNDNLDSEIVQIINLLNSDENKLIYIINSFSLIKFEQVIEKFKKLFPTKQNDIKLLDLLYIKYQKLEEDIYFDKCIMLDIFESNLCYEEYCAMTGYSFSQVKKSFANLWNTKNLKYQRIINYIKKRSKVDFYKKMNGIIKNIYLEENFDIFKYYKYTKMEMKDLVTLTKQLVENTEIKEKVVSKIHYLYLRFNVKDASLACEKIELNVKTILNGREITPEEKSMIFEYMKKNRMHNYQFIYRLCLLEYVNGGLDLKNMQYIK